MPGPMPASHLDWSATPPAQVQAQESKLTIILGTDQRAALAQSLSALTEDGAFRTFRVTVRTPGEWTLHFKLRKGDSRVIVAHPESELWVATVALTGRAAQEVASALTAGKAVSLGPNHSFGPVSSVSNLEVSFT